jgi:hypothetical protein
LRAEGGDAAEQRGRRNRERGERHGCDDRRNTDETPTSARHTRTYRAGEKPVSVPFHTTFRRRRPTAGVSDAVELGVSLLASLDDDELTLAEAMDRLETVTSDPHTTRTILDTAEKRGIIERADGRIRVRSGGFVRFERDVVAREGEFTCRRCGASLTTGHFIQFDASEHGPFGSSCIRTVIGRR